MFNDIDFDSIDITQEAPVEEPARQYYFIAKAKLCVQELSKKLGRKPTYVTQTFGCRNV